MKQGTKYLRVMFKLYVRSLKRSPHVAAISLMAIVTFGLTSYVSIDAWNNHGRFAESTFTKWNNTQKNITGRHVANTQTAQCNPNDINYNYLKKEIAHIESQFETGHYIQGNWYGVDFKSLPSIQAQFLADYGQYLGNANKSKDFSHCKDVTCIIGSFYQGDNEAGLLAYYWYLKTGSMISMSNIIPGQNSKYPGNYNKSQHIFKDYLFSKQELKKFFILAKSLPEKFLHNPLLKSVHKIPNHAHIEDFSGKQCAQSTANGHILLTQNCIGQPNQLKPFLINMSSQMARYIDLYEGRKEDKISLSHSLNWLDRSLWIQEPFFNARNKTYKTKWYSHLPNNQYVSQLAKAHPSAQLAELMAYYRFDPAHFVNKTPADIQELIKTKIFNNQQFDGNGLYKQYVTSAVNQWSKSEVTLWADCFEEHLNPKALENSARNLASQVDNPLYSCVERKIPHFVEQIVQNIKNENYEGCRFFNNKTGFGHLAQKFHNVLDKFLQERILKRKIEFQNHGLEVLVGQSIKSEFIQNIDPSSVFINCHDEDNKKECYEKKMLSEVNKLINQNHSELSDYYKKIIKDDILQLYPYSVVVRKTNKIAKKFIAPFYSKIHYTAKYLWSECKNDSFTTEGKIKLPLKFSGGKHFVNANLLNCINSKIDDELYEIVDLGAFHEEDEKIIEFQLNDEEKDFALTFMEGKLVQILNNILDEEVQLEQSKLKQHFAKTNKSIAKDLINDTDFFEEVYSFNQVSMECLERVQDYYPNKYFYQSTAKIDQKYGRKICSTIISEPEVKSSLTQKVEDRWKENKEIALELLEDHFTDYVEECNDDYPVEMGRAYMRNSRLRKICIEESYDIALSDAMMEWQDEEFYDYFKHREQQLGNYLYQLKNQKVQKSIGKKQE